VIVHQCEGDSLSARTAVRDQSVVRTAEDILIHHTAANTGALRDCKAFS
jgi:hypothetical protein